jgi:hypothetical protein
MRIDRQVEERQVEERQVEETGSPTQTMFERKIMEIFWLLCGQYYVFEVLQRYIIMKSWVT